MHLQLRSESEDLQFSCRIDRNLSTGEVGLRRRSAHQRKPDGYVRRVIRGMLPWKKPGGKDAFHRVKVYIGTPSEYQDRPATRVADADASRLRVPYITIAQLSGEIGGYPQ